MVTPVDEKMDRNYYFTKPSLDAELELTFDRAGKKVNVKIHPESPSNLRAICMMTGLTITKKRWTKKQKPYCLCLYERYVGPIAGEIYAGYGR
jgi:tricorn protease